MEVVYAALVTTLGGVFISLIQKSRKENKQDHGAVTEMIKLLHSDVTVIDQKLDQHIDDHLKENI
jgi:hypothetical protein